MPPADSLDVGVQILKDLPADGQIVGVDANLDDVIGGLQAQLRVEANRVEVLDGLIAVPCVVCMRSMEERS